MEFIIKNVAFLFVIFLNSLAHAASTETFFENSSGAPVIPLIESARNSIDMEIYEIENTNVQKAILNAMTRGVRVRIIQESESVGSNCPVFDQVYAHDPATCRVQKEFIQNVRAKGGRYVPFAYTQFCGTGKYRCLEHGKMIIVDHERVLVSTGNFNPTNLCDPSGSPMGQPLSRCNRDYTVISTDPNVVSSLLAVFDSDFKSKPYDLTQILNSPTAKKVTVSPYSLDPLVQFILSAKKTILLQNQYMKNPELNQALIKAAKKGVKVFVMVNSICTFSRPDPVRDQVAIDLWKNTFKSFDAAGIKSRNFTKKIPISGYSGYLHSKAIVVDGDRAWVGSVNGSTMATSQNREFGIFLEDEEQVQKLANYIANDFNDSNTESWQESLDCLKD